MKKDFYYELIKCYPNSPQLGTRVKKASPEYYIHRPEEWPKFWKKVKYNEENLFLSQDGVTIRQGDSIHWIDETSGRIVTCTAYAGVSYDVKKYYSTYNAAYNAAISMISLEIHGETIIGENIPLYGVLPKEPWQLIETTSYIQFWNSRKKNSSWKFFRTKEDRAEWIEKNRQSLSISDVMSLSIQNTIESETFLLIRKEDLLNIAKNFLYPCKNNSIEK